MGFSTYADIYDKALPWQWRVIRASMPTTTGAIVRAALAKISKNGNAYAETADILPNGVVITKVRRKGNWGEQEPIGNIIAVRDNVRRLADHCKLDDAEREALFEELRRWIKTDYRAIQHGIREHHV